jgi:hypothetical protein
MAMAFNPFEAFSIRSKLGRSVMAILGIVVMLTFVLSSGAVGSRNDFFDQLTTMFSSKKRGDVLATGYGSDIRDADLADLRRQRRAANEYMERALEMAYANWVKELKDSLESPRLSAETKGLVDKFLNARLSGEKNPRAYDAYLSQFTDPQRSFMPDVGRLREALLKARDKQDSEDKRALEGVVAIMAHDTTPPPHIRILPELRDDSDRDLLDYWLLLKKADQLGINYSREGVIDMISHDTLGRLGPNLKDGMPIERDMRQSGRFGDFSPDWLIDAIGNEYRARAALSALQGETLGTLIANDRRDRNQIARSLLLGDTNSLPNPGVLGTASALPGAMTPYEFFEFYKDRSSEHTFKVLEISADTDEYLSKVTGEPTDKEKKDLFNKYRNELPDPSKDRPGFKEPRKLKVEYVSLDAKAPRITDAIPKLQAASLFLGVSTGVIAGDPISALASASHVSLAETLPLKEAVSLKMQENLSPYKNPERWDFVPRDTSVFQPRPIVSALGKLAGYPDVTTFVGAIASVHENVHRIDIQTRTPFLLQAWLTPFNPTMGNALGMPAFAYALNPKLPPEGLYLGEVAKQSKEEQRHRLFKADFEHLETKLREIAADARPPFGGKPDKTKVEKARAEGKKYMDEWLKDRKLTPSGTKGPIDEYSVKENPDLKVLNDLAAADPDGTNSLSKKFFEITDLGQLDPRFAGQTIRTNTFEPKWFPSEPVGDAIDKPSYVAWTSEEIDPKTYPTLENADRQTNGDMSKRVERAWRLEKARALAKADAEKLADEMRNIAKSAGTNPIGAEMQLKDLAAQKKVREFTLRDLALLKFDHEATRFGPGGYSASKIDKKDVPYPTPNFVNQLLELRKQPVGGVTVLADQPRTHYYVACEVDRREKTVDDFREVFSKTAAPSMVQNPLYEGYALPEERFKALEEVKLRLHADAKLEEKDAFKNREKKDTE